MSHSKITTAEGYVLDRQISDTDEQKVNQLIPDPINKKVLIAADGQTRDIVNEVLQTYADSRNQLKQFGQMLQGANLLETCRNIWTFWKKNVTYKLDPEGVQWIKSPAAFWNEGRDPFGDCKSFSIAVACSLHALDIKGAFRFVSFGSNTTNPTHVYVMVKDLGQEIIIDCVWHTFNSQKPYAAKWDYNMSAIYQISGVGGDIETGNGRGILQIDDDMIGDITDVELDLLAHKQLLEVEQQIAAKRSGIGSTHDNAYEVEIAAVNNVLYHLGKHRGAKNKFKPVKFAAWGHAGNPKKRVAQINPANLSANRNPISGYSDPSIDALNEVLDARVGSIFSKIAKGLGKGVKAVGKGVKKAGKGVGKGLKKVGKTLVKFNPVVLAAKGAALGLKAIAKLALKVELPKNAPFFLYTFINDPKDPVRTAKLLAKLPVVVKNKMDKANEAKKLILEKIKINPATFDTIIRSGIMKRYFKSPEEVLAQWMTDANFQVGIIPIDPEMAAGALKLAGSGIKFLLTKLAGKAGSAIADLENYAPDPADWETSDSASNNALAQQIRDSSANNDVYSGRGTVPDQSEQQIIADYNRQQSSTNYGGTTYTPYNSSSIDPNDVASGSFGQRENLLSDVVLPPGKRTTLVDANTTTDDASATDAPTPPASNNNTGMLILAGVAALALLSGGKK